MSNYSIDPDFVVPQPTAARFFCYWTLDDYSAEKRDEVLAGWRKEGVQSVRVTLVNDEYPNDPYPHGYWLEGWTDRYARHLPFGEAERPGTPIYPPLTYDNNKLAVGA